MTTNRNQLARVLGVTPRRVHQLVEEGLPQLDRGKYDLGVCMQWYIRYLQKALAARSTGSDSQESVLTAQRTRLLREKVDWMALANDRRRSQLLIASEIRSDFDDLVARLDAIFALVPERTASAIAGKGEEEIVAGLRRAIRASRNALADAIADKATRAARRGKSAR